MENKPIKQRTKELFNSISSAISLNEILTTFYQNRPLHAHSDKDELTLTIHLRPNKFVKKSVGKNVNIIDSLIEFEITNEDGQVIDKIYGLGTGESPVQSVNNAASKITLPVDKDEEFIIDNELE